jgi:hypothetical protein
LGDLGVCESGDVGGVELLEFNGGAPAQGTVASLPIVEDLQVLKDRIGELHAGLPSPAVQQFGLHAGPEGLDDGVVVGVPDGAIEGSSPDSLARWVNAQEVNCEP